MEPTLVVRALDPQAGRQTSVQWVRHPFSLAGDNHIAHGGTGTGPDGFDLLAAALGQCLLNTLLEKAQRDAIAITSASAVVSTKSRLRGSGRAPYLSDFLVELYLEGSITESERRDLEQWARTRCGVRETLLQLPTIEERVHVGSPPNVDVADR